MVELKINSDTLVRARKRAGLTQEELCKKVEITQGYLSIVETGKKGCSAPVVRRIAKALGLEVKELAEVCAARESDIQDIANNLDKLDDDAILVLKSFVTYLAKRRDEIRAD